MHNSAQLMQPETWQPTTLGELVTSHWSGYSFRSDDYTDSGIPVLTKGDIKPRGLVEHGTRFVAPALVADKAIKLTTPLDLLVTTRDLTTAANFLGLIAKAPTSGAFAVNQGVTVFRVNESRVNRDYLAYWCEGSSYRGYVKGHFAGATQIHIRHGDLMAAPVLLPSLGLQQKIASSLSAYDDLIENNMRRIVILEEITRRIYEEWFVRFRFPGYEKVRMVESELGLVPEAWKVHLLGEEIELAYGKALKAEDRAPGGVPVYGSSGVVGHHSAHLVGGPGIIVGRKGNVGSVHWCDVPFFPIDTVFYVKTALPLHYVFFNLQRQNFLNNDAAVPGLSRNQAYALPLLLPSSDVLSSFEALSAHLLGLARLLARKNVNLRATRDLLLPKLISGQMDESAIPDPEAIAA
jgi:type I restriction enzyme, S subunit